LKKALISLFIILICISAVLNFNVVYANPSITRVQGNARGGGSSSPLTVTLVQTPTDGNVLIAVIGSYGSTGISSVSSIEDGNGKVTWTKQVSKNDGYYRDVEIWLGVITSGASTTQTVTLSGSLHNVVADICEYSGIVTSNFLDKTATHTAYSSNPDTGTTTTTGQANELWIGGTAIASQSQSTPTNGFSLLDGTLYGYISVAYLEKIVSLEGTANSGTTADGDNFWVGCIATFKASVTKSWNKAETWKLQIRNPIWCATESWKLSVHNYAWFISEMWKLNLHNYTWFLTESWKTSIHTLKWFTTEMWKISIHNYSWFLIETWKISLRGYTWFLVEIWQYVNIYGFSETTEIPIYFPAIHHVNIYPTLLFFLVVMFISMLFLIRKRRQKNV